MTSAAPNRPDGVSLCCAEDNSNLHSLLLRRDVENLAAVDGRMQHSIRQSLLAMAGSVEFSSKVARAVAERGFGAAAAESDRLLFVEPRVLPRDADWVRRHAEMIASLPVEQTDISGIALFCDDGAGRRLTPSSSRRLRQSLDSSASRSNRWG